MVMVTAYTLFLLFYFDCYLDCITEVKTSQKLQDIWFARWDGFRTLVIDERVEGLISIFVYKIKYRHKDVFLHFLTAVFASTCYW